jgi:hypothetical protein
MNTPITEAQYQLAHEIRQSSYQEKAAQLIADSEARAELITRAGEIQTLATITAERDQLRAEVLNESHWAAHYLTQAITDRARAERAEAELATERARLDWFHEAASDRIWLVGQDIRAAIDAAMKEDAK